MSKCFLLVAISLQLLFISHAQVRSTEIGLVGGLTIGSAGGKGIIKEKVSKLSGFMAGAQFKVNTTENFGIKALLLYEQTGWAYRNLVFPSDIGDVISKSSLTHRFNYISIPVLAEYSYGNKIKLTTNAGFFIGALLNSKTITESKSPDGQVTTTSSVDKSNYKKLNFGIAAGVGTNIRLSKILALTINANSNIGLANISKPSGSDKNAIRTTTVSISGGLIFTL